MGTTISDAPRHSSVGRGDKLPVSKAGAKGHHNVVDLLTGSTAFTLAAARSIDGAADVLDGSVLLVVGRAIAGDCKPFTMVWDDDHTGTDDGATIIRPEVGDAASGPGRFVRQHANPSQTFADSDATPSIASGDYFVTAGTPPAAITDFDDAYEGQFFTIERGAADQVITHNASVIDCGGADVTLTVLDPRAVFQHVNGVHKLIGQRRTVLNYTQAFTSGDATPSVLGRSYVSTAGATKITNFDDGVEGQVIHVFRGAADIEIEHNSNIATLGGADITLSAYQPMATFRLLSGVWTQQYAMGLGSVIAAPGDNVPFRWDFGVGAGTDYPSARIGGPARGGFMGGVFMAVDVGDACDYGAHSIDGTRESPESWTGFYPHVTFYSWSPHVAQPSRPNEQVTYIGRHFQLYGGQTQTPADGALGGWVSLGATKNDTITPWSTLWISGVGTHGGRGVVFPGRSNVPDMEARVTDGGTLITGAYVYPTPANAFSAGIVNPNSISALGNIHLITSDNSVSFAAIAIRNSDALTYGFDVATDHGNDTLIVYPVVSGSRGTNAIEFDNDGNIRPLVSLGSDLGDSTHVFGSAHIAEVLNGATGVKLGLTSSTPLKAILSAAQTLNFGNVPAGAFASLTMTVTGALTSDIVFVSSVAGTLDNTKFSFDAYVSASDTVTVLCRNHSGADTDPGNQTIRAVVLRF